MCYNAPMEALKQKAGIISQIKRDQLIFAGVIALLAFVAWFSFYLIVYQVAGGAGIWIFSSLAFLAFAISVGLSFFLLASRRLAIATYAIDALIAFPLFGWRGIEIFAILAFFTATFFAYRSVRRELENSISFRCSRLLRAGLPIFFTGLAFTLALFYNTSPAGRISEVPQLSRGFVSIVLIPAEYSIKTFVPEFRRDMKISEVITLNVRGLAGSEVRSYFAGLPEQVQTKTATEFFQTLINDQLRATVITHRQFLPFIYLISLFFVFRAFAMPIMWLAIVTGWITIKIMLALGILELRKVATEKEELVL